jgi:DNA cross-link repair 1C protein
MKVGSLRGNHGWQALTQLLDITVERLFSQQCSGDKFRHDHLMKERFRGQDNDVISNIDTQLTVSSASNAARLSQASATEHVPACHSQLQISTNGDGQSEPPPDPASGLDDLQVELCGSPTLGSETWVSIAAPVSLDEFEPVSLQDSQDSAISELAFDTRLQAFQTLLASARGMAGGEIGLLSTTDNHSKLEEELTYLPPLQ